MRLERRQPLGVLECHRLQGNMGGEKATGLRRATSAASLYEEEMCELV